MNTGLIRKVGRRFLYYGLEGAYNCQGRKNAECRSCISMSRDVQTTENDLNTKWPVRCDAIASFIMVHIVDRETECLPVLPQFDAASYSLDESGLTLYADSATARSTHIQVQVPCQRTIAKWPGGFSRRLSK